MSSSSSAESISCISSSGENEFVLGGVAFSGVTFSDLLIKCCDMSCDLGSVFELLGFDDWRERLNQKLYRMFR